MASAPLPCVDSSSSDPNFFGEAGGLFGAEPTPTPTPEATLESTPEPTATPEPSAPPLAQSFTSDLHGYSVSYPEGWTAQAATEPWTDTFPHFGAGPKPTSCTT